MGRRVEIRRVMRSDSLLERILLIVMRQEWKGGGQKPSREAEVVCGVQCKDGHHPNPHVSLLPCTCRATEVNSCHRHQL